MKLAILIALVIVVGASTALSFETAEGEALEARIDSLSALLDQLERQAGEVHRLLESARQELAAARYLGEVRGGTSYVLSRSANLKAEPGVTRLVVAELARGAEVRVLEYVGENYWRVAASDLVGYLHHMHLDDNVEFELAREAYEQDAAGQAAEERAQREEDRDARRLDELSQKYDLETARRIFKGGVWVGMTGLMLLDSQGAPSSSTATDMGEVIHSQWCYGKPLPNLCAYLENGIVTSVQRFDN